MTGSFTDGRGRAIVRALRWAAAHVEEVAASLVVIALCLLAFANIVTRYAMSYSFACSEELEVAGLVWLTMLGAATSDSSGWHAGLAVWARDAGHARIVTGSRGCSRGCRRSTGSRTMVRLRYFSGGQGSGGRLS